MKHHEVSLIAKVCHEANRAYCQSIGDDSQPAWFDAPTWQTESAIRGVENLLNNPDATAEDSHRSWVAQKEAEGWKFGPVKDPANKEHPCLCSYDELLPEHKIKDHIFRSVVKGMTSYAAGF